MYSKQAKEEFQKTMKEKYGQEIIIEEPEEQRNRLLKFFELLIKIDLRDKKTK